MGNKGTFRALFVDFAFVLSSLTEQVERHECIDNLVLGVVQIRGENRRNRKIEV